MPASSPVCGHWTAIAALHSTTLLPLACCDVARTTTLQSRRMTSYRQRNPLSCEEHGCRLDVGHLTAHPTVAAIRGKPVNASRVPFTLHIITSLAYAELRKEHSSNCAAPTQPPTEQLGYDWMSLVIVSAGPRSTQPRRMCSTACGYTGVNKVCFSTERIPTHRVRPRTWPKKRPQKILTFADTERNERERTQTGAEERGQGREWEQEQERERERARRV
ncbi:hypothetical protein DFH09DRAFT_1095263 [Mycena vulgaris]|nr:hypothetical protein DFH09DRAFT_1095263 [Mycena vulgaris]